MKENTLSSGATGGISLTHTARESWLDILRQRRRVRFISLAGLADYHRHANDCGPAEYKYSAADDGIAWIRPAGWPKRFVPWRPIDFHIEPARADDTAEVILIRATKKRPAEWQCSQVGRPRRKERKEERPHRLPWLAAREMVLWEQQHPRLFLFSLSFLAASWWVVYDLPRSVRWTAPRYKLWRSPSLFLSLAAH